MRAAVAFEITRLRTTVSTWWALGASVVCTVVFTVGFALLVAEMARTTTEPVTGTEMLIAVLTRAPVVPLSAAVLGMLAVAPDWRSGAIDTALLVTPRRTRSFLAKLASTLGAATMLSLVNLAAAWFVVVLVLPAAFEQEVAKASVVAANVGLLVQGLGWAGMGLAVGAIVRSFAGAFGALMLAAFVVEPAVRLFLSSAPLAVLRDLAAFLPFAAGRAMTATPSGGSVLLAEGAGSAEPLVAGLVFAGYVVAVVWCGSLVFERSDT